MNIDFKELENITFRDFFQARSKARDGLKVEPEAYDSDEYFHEGNRLGYGADIEFLNAEKPLELEVTFSPPSDVNKYWHESGILVIGITPLWHSDTKTKARNNRIFLPSSEQHPLRFHVKPHKVQKNIYVGFIPILFVPATGHYNPMGIWSALNFKK
jgi:hypothetical protein